MSKTPQYDSAVKKILDQLVPGERVCALTGEKWLMTDEEIGWYKKFNVPPSKYSPMTRAKILFGFASGLNIWWKPHTETGTPLLSCIHNESPYKVLPSRDWGTREFARSGPEINLIKPFFDQMRFLARSIPVAALREDGDSVNTIGTDMLSNENSWMVFSCGWVKNLFYSALSYRSDNCLDVVNSKELSDCYTLNHCEKMHDCAFCLESRSCLNSDFLFDCRNCENCFGAVNARNKKYLWFGQQLSQDEWVERRQKIDLSKKSEWKKLSEDFIRFMRTAVWPENFNIGGQDCRGEYMLEAVSCHECYRCETCSENYQGLIGFEFKNAAFSAWYGWGSSAYNSCDLVSVDGVKFCFRVWYSTNLEYCTDCMNCENCFGCIGLQRKKFHIFNTPYSEEGYWKKVDELKCVMLEREEYGEYFPADFSAVGFQFSMGDALFNYSEEELKQFSAPIFDPNKGAMVVEGKTNIVVEFSVADIPDDLNDPKVEGIVGKPINDPGINRNFTITAPELAFYRNNRLPLPCQHFLTRLKKLMAYSNMPVSELTVCANCQKESLTYKNSTFTERKVFCRACYLKYLEENN